MERLPWLVSNGAWVWPLVGAGIAGLCAALTALWLRRRLGVVRWRWVAAASVAGALVYRLGVGSLGDALVGTLDRPGSGYAPSPYTDPHRWVASPPRWDRLVLAAATPARARALRALAEQLEPAATTPAGVEVYLGLLRLGGRCEQLVVELFALAREEEMLREATRCPDAPKVQEARVRAHAHRGDFAAFGEALEAALAQYGEPPDGVTHASSPTMEAWLRSTPTFAGALVLGRRWEAVERLAGRLASVTRGDASEARRATWECVALAARYRRGDAAALSELRSRPMEPGAAYCRLFAADATGALDDLQALADFPIEAADLAGPAEPPPVPRARAAIVPLVQQFLDVQSGMVARPTPTVTGLAADWDRAYARRWDDANAFDAYAFIRTLVLATHAPGSTANLVHSLEIGSTWSTGLRGGPSPKWLWPLGGMNSPVVGLVLRATRALAGRRDAGGHALVRLAELLPHAAMVTAAVGQHDLAASYLARAFELRLGISDADWPMVSVRDDAEFLLTAVAVLLRSGASADAIAAYDAALAAQYPAVHWPARVQRERIHHLLPRTVGPVLGLLGTSAAGASPDHRLSEVAGTGPFEYNTERTIEAIEAALGGDGTALARLDPGSWSEAAPGLAVVAPRLAERGIDLKDALRTVRWSQRDWEPGLAHAVVRLHLAERAGDVEWVARFGALAERQLEAMVAADVALLYAVVANLDPP